MHIFYTLLHALSTLHRLQSEHEAVTCTPLPSRTLMAAIVVAFAHFLLYILRPQRQMLCGFQLTLLNIKYVQEKCTKTKTQTKKL